MILPSPSSSPCYFYCPPHHLSERDCELRHEYMAFPPFTYVHPWVCLLSPPSHCLHILLIIVFTLYYHSPFFSFSNVIFILAHVPSPSLSSPTTPSITTRIKDCEKKVGRTHALSTTISYTKVMMKIMRITWNIERSNEAKIKVIGWRQKRPLAKLRERIHFLGKRIHSIWIFEKKREFIKIRIFFKKLPYISYVKIFTIEIYWISLQTLHYW